MYSIFYILKLARHYKMHVFTSIIFMIISAASLAILSYLFKPAFDKILYQPESTKEIFNFCTLLLIVFCFKGLSYYGELTSLACIGNKIIKDLQYNLFNKFIYTHLKNIKNYTTGELVSHIVGELEVLRQNIIHLTRTFFRDLLAFLLLIGLTIYHDYKLAAITVAAILVAIIPVFFISKKLSSYNRMIQNQNDKISTFIVEIFRNIRIVKAFTQETLFINKFKNLSTLVAKRNITLTVIGALTYPLTEITGGLMIVSIVGYGSYHVYQGLGTTGSFVSFLSALILAYEPLKRLTFLPTYISQINNTMSRIRKNLDLPKENFELEQNETVKMNGNIKLDNVSFTYDDKQSFAVRNVSLEITQSKRIGIIGESGSGKSTLLNLILKFYTPSTGHITIDGNQDVALQTLRNNISLVSQEFGLFNVSIRDNIAYGLHSENISDIEIINAAKMAQAHKFIMQLPNQYDTVIGEEGLSLSGGQRQRIAIARALIKKASIILLDEATSALDTDTQKEIDKILDENTKGKTVIMVTHKLNSLYYMDYIYVMKNGKIVDKGNFKDIKTKYI